MPLFGPHLTPRQAFSRYGILADGGWHFDHIARYYYYTYIRLGRV